MTSICFILRQYGVHITRLHTNAMFVCSHTTGRIIDGVTNSTSTSTTSVNTGIKSQLSTNTLTHARTDYYASSHTDGKKVAIIPMYIKCTHAQRLKIARTGTALTSIIKKRNASLFLNGSSCFRVAVQQSFRQPTTLKRFSSSASLKRALAVSSRLHFHR